MPSFGMCFCEEFENHGHEAQNLRFERVLPMSPNLAPFWPLMPSIGMLCNEGSGNHGLEAQNLYG
jgi:hypothetical protein